MVDGIVLFWDRESGALVHTRQLGHEEAQRKKISPNIGVVSKQGLHNSLVSQFELFPNLHTDVSPREIQLLATAALDGSVFLLDTPLGDAEKPEGSMVSKDVPEIKVDSASLEPQDEASEQ